jgi:hypothetical protein
LVEHATENRSVGGSIPPLGTKYFFQTNDLLRRRFVAKQAIFALGIVWISRCVCLNDLG